MHGPDQRKRDREEGNGTKITEIAQNKYFAICFVLFTHDLNAIPNLIIYYPILPQNDSSNHQHVNANLNGDFALQVQK